MFAYLQIERGAHINAPLALMLNYDAEWETLLVGGFLLITAILFGPGAVGSFGLAIREQGLRTGTKPTKGLRSKREF